GAGARGDSAETASPQRAEASCAPAGGPGAGAAGALPPAGEPDTPAGAGPPRAGPPPAAPAPPTGPAGPAGTAAANPQPPRPRPTGTGSTAGAGAGSTTGAGPAVVPHHGLDRDLDVHDAAHRIGQVLRGGAAVEGVDQALGAEADHERGAVHAVDMAVLGDQRPAGPTDLLQLVEDRGPVAAHLIRLDAPGGGLRRR